MAAPSDPLYASQWHFKLMGNISAIWDEYRGRGISVAVYDDGVQYTHTDLNDTYDASKHFTYNGVTYDPFPIALVPDTEQTPSDAHGTNVSGLIAAESGNRLGGVGVASGARVTGVNVLANPDFLIPDEGYNDIGMAAFRHAANFDIMSNSWGYYGDYADFLNRADSGSQISLIEDALEFAAATGRDGLGTVVVKAAGNDAINSNGEGLNGSRFLIDVAAITKTGAVTDYSNFGTSILIAAAEASVTTDLMGADGYNIKPGSAGNYSSTFNGTSAATPLVSGVVALMLEANAGLGWRDVREILATSAALTGWAVDGKVGYESMRVVSQMSGNWNGGGRVYSDDYGFGRLDAFAAVRMAEAWALWAEDAHTSANEQHISITTPDGFSTELFSLSQDTFLDVTDEMWIDHIDVTVTIMAPPFTPTDDYQLSLGLTAPDGTYFEFFDLHDSDFAFEDENGSLVLPELDFSQGFSWTFGISQALGMNAFGTWRLEDFGQLSGFGDGFITDVTLDFYGSPTDTTGDDVHHITNDFLRVTAATAGAWNGGRDKIINDINGGIDWLNMSAIASAVTVSLGDLGKILVAGKLWATLATGAAIENLVTGDGADKITGSSLANEIHAMRGADIINGLAGEDSLFGGAGVDQLFGGADGDVLNGDAGNDVLDGGLGDDTVYGGSGGDVFAEKIGGGNDVFYGGTGKDKATLGVGNDVFQDDAETGLLGADTVTGGLGDDSLFGAGGSDSLSGEAGNDSISGGEGNDILSGGLGFDQIDGGDGNDMLTGGDGDDVLTGGAGNDKINGDLGNDDLFGGAGNDIFLGGAGADYIDGGTGNDVLTGGATGVADADVFVFNAGFGADKVMDFRDNIDTLAFSSAFWGDFTVASDFVSAYARQVGSNVVFDFLNGNVVTVTGLRSLTAIYDDLAIL